LFPRLHLRTGEDKGDTSHPDNPAQDSPHLKDVVASSHLIAEQVTPPTDTLIQQSTKEIQLEEIGIQQIEEVQQREQINQQIADGTNQERIIQEEQDMTDIKVSQLTDMLEEEEVQDIQSSISPILHHDQTTQGVPVILDQYSYVFTPQEEIRIDEFLPIISVSPIVSAPPTVSSIKSVPQPEEFSIVPFVHFKNVELELEGGDSSHVETFTPVDNVDRIDTEVAGIEFDEVILGDDNIPVFNIFPSYDQEQSDLLSTSGQTPIISSTQVPSTSLLPTLPSLTSDQLSYLEIIRQNILDPAAPQDQVFDIQSSPVIFTSSLTLTHTEQYKITFRNKPIITTVTSMEEVTTLITSYITNTVQPFTLIA